MKDTMKKIRGVYALASVPFHSDGSVDFNAFESLVDYLVNRSGTNGLGLYGMVSEFHKMSDYEKTALSSVFLNGFRGSEVVSLLSITDWSTDVAVRKAKEYERLGADSVMLLPPFYFSPHIDDVRHHITSVLEAVNIPVVIQYAPQATGHYLPDEELVAMAEKYKNAAFKIEYKPAVDFLKNFLVQKADMAILTGYAGLEMVDLYKIGVAGVMPGCSFVEVYAAMYKAFVEGDVTTAQQIYDKLEKYLKSWMQSPESLLAIEKEILVRRGLLRSAYCRRPRYHLTDGNAKEIDQFLVEFHSYLG